MIERELAAKRITELEAELAEVREENNRLHRHYDEAAPEHNLLSLLDLYHDRTTEAEAKLAEAEVNTKRLLETIDLIESDRFGYMRRADFAAQVLSGEFGPPTIAEIRRARGLEPL